MASVSISVTPTAQEMGIEGTVKDYVQALVDAHIANVLHDKKYHDFNDLTDEQKDTAITAGKGS